MKKTYETIQDFLDDAWEDVVVYLTGKEEIKAKRVTSSLSFMEAMLNIRKYFFQFGRLMVNRLVLGDLRYGRIGEMEGKPDWERVPYMAEALRRYRIDGDKEALVDLANMALLEYFEGPLKNKKLKGKDDESHCKF